MTNMNLDSYNDLRFSDEAKARMTQALAQAARDAQAEPSTQAEPASFAASAPQAAKADVPLRPVHAKRAAAKRARRPFAAAAAAAVAALAIGGAAYASGALVSVSDLAADVFGNVANTQVIDAVGRPVEASDSDGGVTVTADAIIGDRENYTVVYSIVRDDGQPFDLPDGIETDLLPMGFDEYDASLGVFGGSYGSLHFYDADPSDPAIQMVDQSSLDEVSGSIIGSTMHAHFEGLHAHDADNNVVPLAKGSWDLHFKVDYEDLSIDLPTGQTVAYNDLTGTVERAYISPITLTFDLVVSQPMDWEDQESGQMSSHNSQVLEQFLTLPEVTVTMNDGTSFTIEDNGGATEDLGSSTRIKKAIYFDQIIDVNEVASVTICGEEIPVAL